MSSLVLWPHFYRKEKWLFQNLLRPISTEARGEHLCLQKLLLDKSSRPSPSPHKPSELLQLGRPGLKNTFTTDVFIDLFYWSGEGCFDINASTIPVGITPSSCRLAVLGRSQSLGLGTVRIMTALKKPMNTRRWKTLSETRKVELWIMQMRSRWKRNEFSCRTMGAAWKTKVEGTTLTLTYSTGYSHPRSLI